MQNVLCTVLFNALRSKYHQIKADILSSLISIFYPKPKVNMNKLALKWIPILLDEMYCVFFSENVTTARLVLSDPDMEKIIRTSVSSRLASCHSLLSVLSQAAVSREPGVDTVSSCSGLSPPQVSCHLCYGLFALTHRVELRYSSTNQVI